MTSPNRPSDSPTLAKLKADHPSICFLCGNTNRKMHRCDHRKAVGILRAAVEALDAQHEADAARIAKLSRESERRLQLLVLKSNELNKEWRRAENAEGQLTAEREALDAQHEADAARIEELRCPETNEEWRILAEDHKRILAQLTAEREAHEATKELLGRAVKRVDALEGALGRLVKMNEDHNAAVERVIGRPLNWTDDYLNEARAALLPPPPRDEQGVG